MRGEANTTCSVHQTLTSEAASVLKQSLGLARRRGHAQVTPLHVAFTLLSSRASDLLRRACLKSQPPIQLASHHPLQCRALELCFNVALNRLPTLTTSSMTTGPLLHHAHHQQPSLSNALVAALKRAQAHQRRGSIEQQQQQQQQQNQPLLAAKVELEQLVLSILDDPSVSRVMREAGFSSPSVKSHIEDSLNSSSVFQYHSNSISGVYSSPPSPSKDQVNCFWPTQYFFNHSTGYSDQSNPLLFPLKNSASSFKLEDVKLVLDVMMSKKNRNTVIVGDSGTLGETLVWELRERVERGDHRLPLELRTSRFIRLRFEAEALRLMKREDVDENYLKELRRKVEESSTINNKSGNNNGGGGACIIYVGDLQWAIYPHESVDGVDYLVKEIAKLVTDIGSSRSAKVWLVSTASLQTYMKCQMRHPPLDVEWGLQTVSVPSGGLGLSLNASSLNEQIIPLLKSPSTMEEKDKLNCCGECSSNYEKEADLCKSNHNRLLSSWLQTQCTEVDSHHQDELLELRRKWNRLCQSLHHGITSRQTATPLIYSTQLSPISKPKQWWVPQNESLLFPDTSSISFAVPVVSNSVPRFRRQNSCTIGSPNLSSLRNAEDKELKITLALGNNDHVTAESENKHNNGSNIEMARWQRINMCSRVLKEYIPWQSENIPGIVEVMLGSCNEKGDIWFLIQGNDQIGKMRMASGIAKSMFGGDSSVLHLKMGATLDEGKVLTSALQTRNDPIVILVEDFDLGDTRFVKLLTDRFENGSAKLGRMIFVLTMSGNNDVVKRTVTTIPMVLKVYKKGSPLNKRKAAKEEDDYYFLLRRIPKNPRITTIDRGMESNNTCKDFSRQSSFNSLDLNIRADDLDDASPVSSDLTREMNEAHMISPCDRLVRSIKNKFFFNRSPARDREMKEVIGSKMKASFDEVYGGGGGAHTNNEVNLGIEDSVLEMVLLGGGDSFVNNVFERWVKEIFKTSLERGKLIINMGGNGISFKLCVHVGNRGGGGGGGGGGGFLGTNLPSNIVVSEEPIEEHV